MFLTFVIAMVTENHVEQLKCASQAIPKHVSVALEITRRMEKKRKAKQMANHKWSAQTKSKEKQLFADMMKDNERLRNNIKILAHLPDLVS
jgi:Skp family chaperone for outer membrane proteins